MTFSRTVAILALLLPVALAAQGAAPQPTAAQLKARAELARQRALQQQSQQTKAPATVPATKTATPQTKTAATGQVPVPQTKTAAGPQTRTVTPTPQTKTAMTTPVPVPQTKTAVPQTKTAVVPPPVPQTKAAPAGSAIAAGQAAAPRLQPKPPAEVTFNREVFGYVKASRRDPFTTMITSSDLRPQITDLKLVTVIRSANAASSVAIMRDLTTNEQYRVRVGQTLGRMRVAQIQQRAVVFSIEEFGYNRQEVVSMDDSTRARTP